MPSNPVELIGPTPSTATHLPGIAEESVRECVTPAMTFPLFKQPIKIARLALAAPTPIEINVTFKRIIHQLPLLRC